jgi:AcrR family transcriptional regulator
MRERIVDAAARLIRRDGVSGLTMRAVAAEAGCSVGLPYQFFSNRDDLVFELVALELEAVVAKLNTWLASAGTSTVAANLGEYADILLTSEIPALLQATRMDDGTFTERLAATTTESGIVRSFDQAMREYLAQERSLGRVGDIDVDAFGFVITGAVHNLVVAGHQYPRPSRDRLRSMLASIARTMAGAREAAN